MADQKLAGLEFDGAKMTAELAKIQDRACLFNLVIYSQSEQRTLYLKEVIQSIIEKFPCRILFIQGGIKADNQRDTQNSLQESFQSNSTLLPSSETEHFFQVAVVKGMNDCSQININASFSELYRVPYIVIPNLVTDLPLYLLWGYDPTEEKIILPQLKPFATRLIFDAESCTSRLKNFSQKILNEMHFFNVDIMDLNWAWISPWRDILTQVFSSEEKIQHLEIAHTVVIEYAEGENCTLTQAMYLQAWIATQLQWTISRIEKQDNNILIRYSSQHSSNKREHTIVLIPKLMEGIPPGSILSLEVATENNRDYSIVRKKHSSLVSVHVSTQTTCSLPFTLALANPRRGLAFLREVFYQCTSEHYQKMLKTIESMNWDQENESN